MHIQKSRAKNSTALCRTSIAICRLPLHCIFPLHVTKIQLFSCSRRRPPQSSVFFPTTICLCLLTILSTLSLKPSVPMDCFPLVLGCHLPPRDDPLVLRHDNYQRRHPLSSPHWPATSALRRRTHPALYHLMQARPHFSMVPLLSMVPIIVPCTSNLSIRLPFHFNRYPSPFLAPRLF